MSAEPITAFSWGYWGWGTAVPRFLEAAALAEAARGFEPPAFADVRFNRSVRAPGFREGALEALVGRDRYRWFDGLGNANIGTTATRIRIAQPPDAELLLDFVLQQAAAKRRVLFFCSCKVVQPLPCHRFQVATLLLEAARARKTRFTVVEWPGGSPEHHEIRVRPSSVKGSGRSTVPLGKAFPQNGLATLPWGSQVRVQLGSQVEHVVTGPASFKGQWTLPVLGTADADDPTGQRLEEMGAEFRAEHGCNAHHSWSPASKARTPRPRRPR